MNSPRLRIGRLGLISAGLALALALPAGAQDVPAGGTPVVVTEAPSNGAAAYQRTTELRLQRWEDKSRRARNALIATSATFGVSWVFLGVAISHCTEDFIGYACDNTGDVLGAIGGVMFWGGGIGMIVSGILLGVRNKRVREVEREMREIQTSGFRWDPKTARFVF